MTQPEQPATPVPGTVADWMLTAPVLCRPASTVGELRAMFTDDHRHAALLVEGDTLVSVVHRADLSPDLSDAETAVGLGRLAGRTIGPDEPAEVVRQRMINTGQRRLAVVDADGRLLGLLCLKRRRHGFCTERDVLARARERA